MFIYLLNYLNLCIELQGLAAGGGEGMEGNSASKKVGTATTTTFQINSVPHIISGITFFEFTFQVVKVDI